MKPWSVPDYFEDGFFYQQRDGVLYDREGNVMSFDPDRVDPKTMSLR